jgi:hypothetical protein
VERSFQDYVEGVVGAEAFAVGGGVVGASESDEV